MYEESIGKRFICKDYRASLHIFQIILILHLLTLLFNLFENERHFIIFLFETKFELPLSKCECCWIAKLIATIIAQITWLFYEWRIQKEAIFYILITKHIFFSLPLSCLNCYEKATNCGWKGSPFSSCNHIFLR